MHDRTRRRERSRLVCGIPQSTELIGVTRRLWHDNVLGCVRKHLLRNSHQDAILNAEEQSALLCSAEMSAGGHYSCPATARQAAAHHDRCQLTTDTGIP